jgi:ABC-type Fe3+ transport system permease subunit
VRAVDLMHRLAKAVRSKGRRSFALLRKLNGPHVRLGLFAAALFALAFAAETKAILALQSSQDLFDVIPHQLLYR